MKKVKNKVKDVIPHSIMKSGFEKVNDKFKGSEKLKCIISDHVHHFRADKWPISVDHVVSDMFRQLTGVDPLVYFIKMLAKNKVKLGLGTKDESMVFYIDTSKPKTKKVSKKTKKKGRK
jgi:hypothetical protein